MSRQGYRRQSEGQITFSDEEIRDLGAAWIALGLAFAIFFGGGAAIFGNPTRFVNLFLVSMLTAGIGFLLHELAHKIVAVRFGQEAAFKANYGMLGLAILVALGGIIFAAPGAVYHRGWITDRENGIIAVAGPITNLLLAVSFIPLIFFPGFLGQVGVYGVLINFFLAAFNMIPFGPLDGRKVIAWSKSVFVITFLASVLATIVSVLVLFF